MQKDLLFLRNLGIHKSASPVFISQEAVGEMLEGMLHTILDTWKGFVVPSSLHHHGRKKGHHHDHKNRRHQQTHHHNHREGT